MIFFLKRYLFLYYYRKKYKEIKKSGFNVYLKNIKKIVSIKKIIDVISMDFGEKKLDLYSCFSEPVSETYFNLTF